MSNVQTPQVLTQDQESSRKMPTTVINPYKRPRLSQAHKSPEQSPRRIQEHLSYNVTHVSQTQQDPEEHAGSESLGNSPQVQTQIYVASETAPTKKVCVACQSEIDGDDAKLCNACIQAVTEEIGFGSDNDNPHNATTTTTTRPEAISVELSSPNHVETLTVKSPGAVIREKFRAACEAGQVIELHLSPKVLGQPQEIVDLTSTPPPTNFNRTNIFSSPVAASRSNPQTGSPMHAPRSRKACIDCGALTMQLCDDQCRNCVRTYTQSPIARGHCRNCGSTVRESWMSLCDPCFRNSSASKRRRFT